MIARGLLLLVTVSAGCATAPGPPPAASPAPTRSSAQAAVGRGGNPVARLQRDLSAIFEAPIMSHAQWSVVVQSLDTGEPLFELNADKLMVPASNMKILTLAGAVHVLGWDYRFTTSLESRGEILDGVLLGDLFVRGGGDPSINPRNGRNTAVFDCWAAALTSAGIQRISGRIIGDDQLFDEEGLGAGWAWDYLEAGYAAPVGALQYNENTAELVVLPGAVVGDPAVLRLPDGTGLTVINRGVTAPPDSPETIAYRRHSDQPVLEVTGTVPLAGSPGAGPARVAVRHVAVVNPTIYFVTSLRNALIARGIAIDGDAVDLDDVAADLLGAGHEEHRTLVRTESPPLREIATVLMKVSQNLYAETLLKAAGSARGGLGTAAAGRMAIQRTLTEWNLDEHPLVIADGSGLSRYNYLTARLLIQVLEHVYRDPAHRDAFTATLPVAGRDGTISTRLRGTRAEGNALAKTGSISNVRSLSGYVRTRDGEALAFSILANDFVIPASTVGWIADIGVEVLANFTRQPTRSRTARQSTR